MFHCDPQHREASAEVVAERLGKFADGADLQALVSRVPDQFKPTLEKPQGVAQPTGAVPAAVASTSRPPVGPVGWGALALASASLFGLVLLAISMLLKTPEGDFRIESDVLDSLTVEVVDEKDHVELIAVDQGKAETSLRAGRYRIRLGLPSDEVKITPSVITISNKTATIAKITRIESKKPATPIANQSPVRDPNVTATARIELLTAMEELNLAKTEQNPDQSKVASLQERVAQLRALSQPIPTEPVYKGRTLADWTAQMRFERSYEAKKDATESVSALVRSLSDEDLPAQQRMQIGFESYARQASWSRSRSKEITEGLLSKTAEEKSATRFYCGIDRKVASLGIAAQLRNDNPIFRRHALISCLYLKHEIRDGEWPGVFDALREAANLRGTSQSLAQLTLAVCCPDAATASKEILKIDVDGVSLNMLTAMLSTLNDTRFDVPRPIQLDWTTHYVSHPEGGDLYDFQDASKSLGGPLAGIDFNKVSAPQQSDIDIVATGLLDRVEKAINNATPLKAFTTQEEHETQHAVADLMGKLKNFVSFTALTKTQAVRSVDLLQRRIGQLVNLRDQSTETREEVFDYLDTPIDAATSILMLGGEVPESLTTAPKATSAYFRPYLPDEGYFDAARDQHIGRSQRVRTTASWFPYQVMPMLDGAKSIRDLHGAEDDLITTIGIPVVFDWLPNSDDNSHTFSIFYQEFFYRRSDATRVSDEVRQCIVDLRRHPGWRKRILTVIQNSSNQSELTIAIRLWELFGSSEEIDTQQRKWLKDGDLMRIRLAIADFRTELRPGSRQFPTELIDLISVALQRIAKEGILSDSDMQDLETIEKHVPDAPKFAREFIEAKLTSGEVAKNEGNRGFYSAAKILEKHPDEIRKIQSSLRSALGDYSPPTFTGRRKYMERDSIYQMLKLIDEIDDGN